MSLPNPHRNSGFLGPALIGACLAVVLSIPIAAYVAAFIGDTYNTRALLYLSMLSWISIGSITLFFKTRRAESHHITVKRAFLWTLSVWCWPLLILASKH